VALLYDCHSIRSHIPFLFEGTLPDFNIGTNSGATCAPAMEERAAAICEAAPGFTMVRNGRFKGGWTARHYGRPDKGVHTLQMELAQSTYLETEWAPFAYSEDKAARLRPHLKTILDSLILLATAGEDRKEA
jgi:N-formylglutamate deformylase